MDKRERVIKGFLFMNKQKSLEKVDLFIDKQHGSNQA